MNVNMAIIMNLYFERDDEELTHRKINKCIFCWFEKKKTIHF